MSTSRLVQAAEILARTSDLDEPGQLAALQAEGFDAGQAHRLVVLLPIAFSRPILEDLGVSEFSPVVAAQRANGTWMHARLSCQPEYVAALEVAREHRRAGLMDQAVYERIAGSSAEINAASEALNAGADLSGAVSATALVGDHYAAHLIR